MTMAKLRAYFHHETAPGVVLLAAAIFALISNNSSLAPLYDRLLETPVKVQIDALIIAKPLLLWINDGLMAVFFFLVGLEIKREFVEGHLKTWRQAALPALAAVGGMLAPALIYVAFNYENPEGLRGWAIPSATDIAFALGALALLGSRIPLSLKTFLLALAIFDDLGAIIIIALFYTAEVSHLSLLLAGAGTFILYGLNRMGVTRFAPYFIVGTIMWVCVLKSGVHATLAGVVLALAIPLRAQNHRGESPLRTIEHALHPWVAFGVMPVFAFANAGVSLAGFSIDRLLEPIPLGIALGLFLGKQAGVLGFVWAGCRLGICRLPAGVGWQEIYGAALLAGIGFTMSLFIGTLAFDDPEHSAAVRIGVLSGSLISGLAGYLVLRLYTRPQPEAVHASTPDPLSARRPHDKKAPA